jgi:hypothetical protein
MNQSNETPPSLRVDLAVANAHKYWDEISNDSKLDFPVEFLILPKFLQPN